MSDIVKCDICDKTADSHNPTNGFSYFSFYAKDEKPYRLVKIDLCWEHSQEMAGVIYDWVEKEKKNYK